MNCEAASGGLVVCRSPSCLEDDLARWFVPPIVVPAAMGLFLVAVVLYRQFAGG
jgi:hypothetical protein